MHASQETVVDKQFQMAKKAACSSLIVFHLLLVLCLALVQPLGLFGRVREEVAIFLDANQQLSKVVPVECHSRSH